jgi:transposase
VFEDRYQNDETGAPAYDPAILLKIILFAYSKGITSSRAINHQPRGQGALPLRPISPNVGDTLALIITKD